MRDGLRHLGEIVHFHMHRHTALPIFINLRRSLNRAAVHGGGQRLLLQSLIKGVEIKAIFQAGQGQMFQPRKPLRG